MTIIFKSEHEPAYCEFVARNGKSLWILLSALGGHYSGDQVKVRWLYAGIEFSGEADSSAYHAWVSSVCVELEGKSK